MAGPFDFLNRPEVLRELRDILATAFGFILSLRGARSIARRRAARKKGRDDSGKARSVAVTQRRTNDSPTALCVHCRRSFRDVKTLGCGLSNRRGACPYQNISG